jgi:oligosaccharide repeat unit polymerase
MTRVHLVALAACAGAFWLRADQVLSGSSGWLLALMIGLVVLVVAIATHGILRQVPDWRWALASPFSMAAITWLTLFALRPAELNASPAQTIYPLLGLGYDTADLSRAVAIGGVGCATWAIGFLVALAAIGLRGRRQAPLQEFSLRPYAPWVLIGIGFALSAALLMRSGGISALIHSPGDLHFNNSQSGFYGQLGAWILEGVALFSFAAILQRQGDNRAAKWILLVSGGLAVSMNLALGSRGLVVFGVLAASVVYLRMRSPSLKRVVMAIACLAVLAALLEFSAVVRTNSQDGGFLEGAERSLSQSPASFQTADLSTFDDLVAMQQLIPSSISRMEGTSLLQIPAALAPRALWPGKPEPVDSRVTAYLYPPGAAAGSPITMQGELFWNFGVPAVAIGSFVIGLLMGWAMLLWVRRECLSILLYAVFVASVYALLTRALGTMVANTVIALVGVGLVALTITPDPWSRWRRWLVGRS